MSAPGTGHPMTALQRSGCRRMIVTHEQVTVMANPWIPTSVTQSSAVAGSAQRSGHSGSDHCKGIASGLPFSST
jgi:hypothetical protein